MAKPIGSQRAFMSIPARDRGDRAATGGEDAERSELGRAGEHEDRHGDRRHRAHDRPCQHAEGHPEGEGREHERQSGAHSGADVAVLVHLGYLTCLRLQLVRRPRPASARRRSSSGAVRCAWTSPTASTGRRAGDPLSPATDALLQRAGAGALGPPARRRARAPAARRERRRAGGRARLATRAAPHLLGARAGSPARAGRPRRRSLATMPRRPAPPRSSPRTTAPGAWIGRRPTRGASASRSRSTPSRCSPTRRALRACGGVPGRRCGWLFLDTSGRRRWCSMTTCGSRVKMRRLYERRRQAERRT